MMRAFHSDDAQEIAAVKLRRCLAAESKTGTRPLDRKSR